MSDYLSADELRARPAPDTETDVEVPEWGGKIRVKALSRGAVYEIRRQATNPDTGVISEEVADALVIVAGVIEPEFSEDDTEWLLSQPVGTTQPILEAILRTSRLERPGTFRS